MERTDSLIATLHGVTLAYRSEGSAEQRLSAIGELIEPEADRILEQCEAHQATGGKKLPSLSHAVLLSSPRGSLQLSPKCEAGLNILGQKHNGRHSILDRSQEESVGQAAC